MFSWFIVTVWFEFNDKLHMQHRSSFAGKRCETVVSKIILDFERNHPNKTLKAAKCNDPIIWFKKYRLNEWGQFIN